MRTTIKGKKGKRERGKIRTTFTPSLCLRNSGIEKRGKKKTTTNGLCLFVLTKIKEKIDKGITRKKGRGGKEVGFRNLRNRGEEKGKIHCAHTRGEKQTEGKGGRLESPP